MKKINLTPEQLRIIKKHFAEKINILFLKRYLMARNVELMLEQKKIQGKLGLTDIKPYTNLWFNWMEENFYLGSQEEAKGYVKDFNKFMGDEMMQWRVKVVKHRSLKTVIKEYLKILLSKGRKYLLVN